jgi:hypothetical protein
MCPRPRPSPRPRVVLRQGQNLQEVGLHQYPSERKGEGGPVRGLLVPSRVPIIPQNAAKVRGFSRTVSAFTAETDCLLGEAGFELRVPPPAAALFAANGTEITAVRE